MADERPRDSERPQTAAEAASRAAEEMAIEAARAAQREEATARFVEEVARVGSAVAHKLALPQILEVILDQSVRTLGARFAYVYLAAEDQSALELVGYRNLPNDLKERLSRIPFDAPVLAARAASTRQAQMISSLNQIDPAVDLTHELLSRMSCESIVALPLIVRDHLLMIFALQAPHEFTREERTALDNCADIFSFGIANAIAYGQEHRLRLLFEAVGNATVAIASEFELWPVLQNIVDEARLVANAEYSALGIVVGDDQEFTPFVFSGMTKEQESAIRRYPGPLGTLGIPAMQVRTVRIADVRRNPALRGLTEQLPAIISLLAVPVRYKGHSLGNLYLANKLGAPQYGVEDARAVELLASHAGAAVHQRQLQDQLRDGTGKVQRDRGSCSPWRAFCRGRNRKGHRKPACFRDRRPVGSSPRWRTIEDRSALRTENSCQGKNGRRAACCGELAFKTQEMLVRGPDGREVPVLLSVAPVHRPGW